MKHLIVGILLSIILVSSQSLTSTKVGSTLDRWNQFVPVLTTDLGSSTRSVNSEGGAAGGIVSEGQGYGILFGAITAASLGSSHPSYADVVTKTYEIWNGWKKMCSMSKGDASCQTGLCGGTLAYPCLPHWKFQNGFSSVLGTGSAPDGDEDAIFGMVLLVRMLDSTKASYSWWNDLAEWTYQSSKQFLDSSTTTEVYSNVNYRTVKLGSCWGGWDCNNPSYHAPAAYRAMRDYMVSYAPLLNKGTEGNNYQSQWNDLIRTSYAILSSDQCASNGLVTNWYVPNANPTLTGTTSCSGSGTPSGEFGAEASRTIWRIAMDYALYPTESSTNSGAFLSRTVKHLNSIYSNGNWGNLATGCLVTSIFASWLSTDNAFIYAPTFAALIYPETTISATLSQTLLDSAATKIATGTITKYYSGSWTAIATFTINGDIRAAQKILGGTPAPSTPPVASPTPKPTPSPTSTPKPTPTPTSTPKPTPTPTSTPSSITCSYAHDDVWWVEVNTIVGAIVSVLCNDGTSIPCTSVPGKYQCVPSVPCPSPRLAIINKVCCSLGKSCVGLSEGDGVAIEQSTSNDSNDIWLGVGCGLGGLVLVAIVVIIAIVYRRRTTTETV